MYTPEELSALDRTRVPEHVAFIPDGNRRWAKANGLTVAQGHQKGADTITDIAIASKALGIKTITVYLFSTENWSRNPFEVRALMWLLDSYMKAQLPTMLAEGIRLHTIGNLSRFSSRIQKTVQQTKEATAHCSDLDMVWGLNYGARDEIRRAVQSLCLDFANKSFEINDLNEKMISQYLDTAKWKDPDLLIRTSGEMRLSNFLLWQTSYAEFYPTKAYWPEFTAKHLLDAVLEFQRRERRLGGA